MAEPVNLNLTQFPAVTGREALIDEARAHARQRFKERFQAGKPLAGCECESEADAGPTERIIGVRFIDSGQTYFFDPGDHEIEQGDWVVVETNRGLEAAKVIIAPSQMLQSAISGSLKPIVRVLSDADVERMQALKREAAKAVKVFGAKIRERDMPMKPISAEYNYDGSHLTLNFTAPERVDFRDLARDLGAHFHCRVELRQVGPRDEARLLGGVGRCGRTLCCSSWLPVFPEVSMNMAKMQDLPLNPSKVSGVCGRLLCCLSYENDVYRQQKQLLPKLGQMVETASGTGTVISLQVLRELVTVRFGGDTPDQTFTAAELGLQHRAEKPRAERPRQEAPTADAEAPREGGSGRKRRRRGRNRGAGGNASTGDAKPQA
ncbi:MAG: stage 0 sporulation family protein [Chloroflexota bacterium]|nr:stage 0 sporulation family protein [Chloroflexota bacterium]